MGVIYIPRLNDQRWDNIRLAQIWREAFRPEHGLNVVLDFRYCDFLRPNAVVVIGGLVNRFRQAGGSIRLAVDTMQNGVKANLCQSGFATAMGASTTPWSGNSIPYREYLSQDETQIVTDLRTNWLGRGWINVSDALASAIVGQMWEIFANGFEHSKSPCGLLCCGQHFPNRHELLLAVADYGVGIPANVRNHFNNPQITGAQAMRWAFTRGASTAGGGIPRGLGLDLLKDFVLKNQGQIQIYSHDGYTQIDLNGEIYDNADTFFEGTLVQVRVLCDDKAYCLSSELNGPFF